MSHILIVDDEPDIREICKTYFEFEGHEVSVAENGQQAIDLLQPTIDLMVLDIMMPEADGYDVVKAMKAYPLYLFNCEDK